MTKYIKFTYVDKRTQEPVSKQPARNGQTLPKITGLNYEFALKSKWPVLNTYPELFGTCPNASNIDIGGVLEQLTLDEYNEIKENELNARKKQYKDRINKLRDQYISQGKIYTFPDGSNGTIQLRDLKDRSNVSDLGTSGLSLKVDGDTTTTVPFRDYENQQHDLNSDQLIEMGKNVLTFIQYYYTISWWHKENIENCATLDELENYNINENWE